MGFEAPLALIALATAALVVFAHLLRRQDLPLRKLPTVTLLRRAESQSRRRVRLVDLLLMLVRILLFAVAALGLAAPFLRVSLAYGDGRVASLAIVIDDSMSMAERGDPTLLARAVTRARAVIDSLPEGSEIAIVRAGAPASVALARTQEIGGARRVLDDMVAPSARGTDLPAAIALAERELAGARHAERAVLVLSDLAAHGGLTGASMPPGIDVRFERIGQNASTRNAAIVDARATPDPTTPGRASVAVEIRAREMNGRDVDVVLRRGGEEVARQGVSIARGGARTILHARIDPADPSAEIAIDVRDAIAADNVRGVLVRPPAGVRVLLVDGDPAPGRGGDEARFLARAIDLAPEQGGALTRRRIDPETLAAIDPSESDVVVLANVPPPSEGVVARLREHVERGGGLWIAAGDQFDPRGYAARFGDLLPARLSAAVAAEVTGPHAAPDNPIVPVDASGLEQTRTTRRASADDVDADAHVVLTFGDGTPALLVAQRGDGRVALLLTTVDDDWTDLPLRPGYLPFAVRLLRYLAPSGATSESAVTPGTPVTLSAPAGTVRMRIVRPDGQSIEHTHEPRVEMTETEAPGVYRVQLSTRERELHEEARLAFVVAPPPEESDLTPGRAPRSSSRAERERSTAIVHRPIAPWFFLLVGILAILEAALRLRAGQLARQAA